MLFVQNAIITAMLAARFDPILFEQNIASVRATMRIAALMDAKTPKEREIAGTEFDHIFDLYVKIFKAGTVDVSGTDSASPLSH